MKIKLHLSIGFPTATQRATIDTVTDWGMEPGEWETLDDDAQMQHVSEWANNYIDFGWGDAE